MLRWLPLHCLLLLAAMRQEPPVGPPAPRPYLTPAEAVLLAYRHARQMPSAQVSYLRYLWRANKTDAEWAWTRKIYQGHCNQMSRASIIRPLEDVPESQGQLLWLDLRWYGWQAETWEKFANTDHVFMSVTVDQEIEKYETEEEYQQYFPGGVASDGKYYAPGNYTYKRKVTKERPGKAVRKRGPATWLAKGPDGEEAVRGLTFFTGSQVPVVCGNVFLENTAASGAGRQPDYYDMIGVQNEADFQKLGGIEVQKDVNFQTDLMAAIPFSGVTQEPRAIQRIEKRGGAYWRSFDVEEGKATGEGNAMRAFGSDKDGKPRLRSNATEQYMHLANGMWAVGLFNDKGEKQARAPDTVAADGTPIKRNNHSVLQLVSCIRCHRNGGLQDLEEDHFRNLAPELNVFVQEYSEVWGKKQGIGYEEFLRLQEQYVRDLKPAIALDRARYAAALKTATDMTPEQYADHFGKAWDYAANPVVDVEYAARELGVPPEKYLRALRWQIEQRKADPVLARFARPFDPQRPTLNKVPLSSWREAYSRAQRDLQESPR